MYCVSTCLQTCSHKSLHAIFPNSSIAQVQLRVIPWLFSWGNRSKALSCSWGGSLSWMTQHMETMHFSSLGLFHLGLCLQSLKASIKNIALPISCAMAKLLNRWEEVQYNRRHLNWPQWCVLVEEFRNYLILVGISGRCFQPKQGTGRLFRLCR